MPTFIYEWTYVVFRGLGARQLFAGSIAWSVAAALLLFVSLTLIRRGGAVRRAHLVTVWLGALCALVAAGASFQAVQFSFNLGLNSYPSVRIALIATTLLLLLAGTIAVWCSVVAGDPEGTGRFLRRAAVLRLAAVLLVLPTAILFVWSWIDLLQRLGD